MNPLNLLYDRLESADGEHDGNPDKNRYLLGECPNGDLWLPPSRSALAANCEASWPTRLNLRNPRHWLYFAGSAIRRRIVFLDGDA